jgi:hypothetical protein
MSEGLIYVASKQWRGVPFRVDNWAVLSRGSSWRSDNAPERAYDATLRSPLRSPTVPGNGVWRWSAASGTTREAVLLRFDSVDVTVSTFCWISFASAQGRIETE